MCSISTVIVCPCSALHSALLLMCVCVCVCVRVLTEEVSTFLPGARAGSARAAAQDRGAREDMELETAALTEPLPKTQVSSVDTWHNCDALC